VLDATFDLYTPTFMGRKVDYEKTLSYGAHTIKIVVKGEKNASSTGYRVNFNAFSTQKLINFSALDYFFYSEKKTVTLNGSGLMSVSASSFTGWERVMIAGVYQDTPGLSASSPKYIMGDSMFYLYGGTPNETITVIIAYMFCIL
jgi:hypothetical protein